MIQRFFQRIKDFWRGNTSLFGGLQRSGKWSSFKKDFEILHPKQCAVCGNRKCSLHHIEPFSKNPSRELDNTNVIWLCEGMGTLQHHRGMGHLGSFLSWNEDIRNDAFVWNSKINNRP